MVKSSTRSSSFMTWSVSLRPRKLQWLRASPCSPSPLISHLCWKQPLSIVLPAQLLRHQQLSASQLWCQMGQQACLIFTRGQFWPSGIVIACVCGSVCPCVYVYQSRACPHDNSSLIQARITKFGPEMQNTLVLGDDRPWPSRSNFTWTSNFTSFWVCLHHNSSAVQARITKFVPKMHLSLVKITVNFGLDWFWSSLSFPVLKPIFLRNLFALFLYYI